jgi:hypothetical protein
MPVDLDAAAHRPHAAIHRPDARAQAPGRRFFSLCPERRERRQKTPVTVVSAAIARPLELHIVAAVLTDELHGPMEAP